MYPLAVSPSFGNNLSRDTGGPVVSGHIQVCSWSDLNTSTEMREVPGVSKESLGTFPAPFDVMIVSYLANLASAFVFQKLFNSNSFIPLAIRKVWTVHSYYVAQITTMFKKVFWKYWSNVKFWHNYVIIFHYKSKLILYKEGNIIFVVLVCISVCGKYNMQCEVWKWLIGSCSSELFLIFMLHCILLLHCPSSQKLSTDGA